jgi:hypothetical protein
MGRETQENTMIALPIFFLGMFSLLRFLALSSHLREIGKRQKGVQIAS